MGVCMIYYSLENVLNVIAVPQKDEVRKIVENCRSYDDVAFIKDYSGYHRVVRMRKKRV